MYSTARNQFTQQPWCNIAKIFFAVLHALESGVTVSLKNEVISKPKSSLYSWVYTGLFHITRSLLTDLADQALISKLCVLVLLTVL